MRDALCVLFTGPAGAGKATVGRGVAEELRRRGRTCALLDELAVDRYLQAGVDPLVWCSRLLVDSGATALVSVAVPARAEREQLRDAIPTMVEVFLAAPAEVCAARAGLEDDEFEEPYAPDLRVPTYDRDPTASVAQVVSFLEERGIAPHDPAHPAERS